jgi:hypothetical protein
MTTAWLESDSVLNRPSISWDECNFGSWAGMILAEVSPGVEDLQQLKLIFG